MSSKTYDLVVLGGGIGGYVAAIRASQLGKTVAIVEKESLGGTCLHRGCIPSKSLLKSAELLALMQQSEQYGIISDHVTVDVNRVQERKNALVEQLYRGVQGLMRKYHIDIFEGRGRIIGPSIFSPRSGSVAVEPLNEEEEGVTLVCTNLIIATGSRARQIPGLEADGERIWSSDEALQMEHIPESVLIVGGGVIGIEWASMLTDFGARVTVIEAEDRILPMEDEEISKTMASALTSRGVIILTNTKVMPETREIQDGGIRIQASGQQEELISLEAQKLLMAVGREANIHNLGLENTDIQVKNSVIAVNKWLQTTESHIYAIGDVTGGVQLAHAAAQQGIKAVEHLAGLQVDAFDEKFIPRCVYSRPEAASIGWTEKEAREEGCDVAIGRIPFSSIGKAWIQHADIPEGFVKVVADRETKDILGVQMVGTQVTELISEAALAKWLDATPWEIGALAHPHPSLSEALGEAMLDVDGMTTVK